MPFPHEVEHCRGRNPQAFIRVFQLVFRNKYIYWLRHDLGGLIFCSLILFYHLPFLCSSFISYKMAYLPEDLPNYIFELQNDCLKNLERSALQKKTRQGPFLNCSQNFSREKWEADLWLLNTQQWKGWKTSLETV